MGEKERAGKAVDKRKLCMTLRKILREIKAHTRTEMSKELQTLSSASVGCLDSLTEDVIHQLPHTPFLKYACSFQQM